MTRTCDAASVKIYRDIHDRRARKDLDVDPGKRIIDYVPSSFHSDESVLGVIYNGRGLTIEQARAIKLKSGDELVLYRVPDGADPLTPAIVGKFVATMLIVSAISMGLSAALTKKVKRREWDEPETFGFGVTANTTRPGTPKPVIYGEHRFGGHIVSQSLDDTPRNAPSLDDFDSSNGALHTLIGVCSGGVNGIESITDIRIDKNPIENFSAVTTTTRLGTLHQELIPGFENTTSQTGVGETVEKDTALTRTTELAIDRFTVVLEFESLFHLRKSGSVSSATAQYKIEYRVYGSASEWSTPMTATISRATRKKFRVFIDSPVLTRARYDVKLTRVDQPNPIASTVSEYSWLSINETTFDSFTYPGQALLAVQQLPTAQVSGSPPAYDALIKGKRVKVYSSASSYSIAWSDSPAWCLLDFVTDSVDGLGSFFEEPDAASIESFIEWDLFCQENEYTLNIVLNGSMTAIETLRQIASCGRAFFRMQGRRYDIKIDREETPVQQFTMGHIREGSFSVHRTRRQDSPNQFVGEIYNSEIYFEPDPVLKEDDTQGSTVGTIQDTVDLKGVTSLDHANKLLNYHMLSSRLLRRTIEFEAHVDSIAMEAGDVFRIAHDVPGWGFSGRIAKSISASEFSIDRDVTIESGKSYQITIVHDDGSYETKPITSNDGTTSVIQTGGLWSRIIKQGEHYTFGEVGKNYVLYRCTSITRSSQPWRRKIQAREHSDDVYSLDTSPLPQPSVSRLPDPRLMPANVSNLTIQERLEYEDDGRLIARIDVYFELPSVPDVVAKIHYRERDTTTPNAWTFAGETRSGYFPISVNVGTKGVTFDVSVTTHSSFGVGRDPTIGALGNITMMGSTHQPDSVTNFIVDRTPDGLVFSWDPIDAAENPDLDVYEIRSGTSWGSSIVVGTTRDTEFRTSSSVKSVDAAVSTYLIKSKNTSGNYSDQAVSVTLLVDPRPNENLVFTRQEDTSWTGVKSNAAVSGIFLVFSPTDATYTTDKFQVSTATVRAIVSTYLESTVQNSTLTWDALSDATNHRWDSTFSNTATWESTAGAISDDVTVKVEMRFSKLTNDDADFGDWQSRSASFDASMKWAQVRVTTMIPSSDIQVRFEKMRILFDVPELIDKSEEDTITASAKSVSFGVDYITTPKVLATIVNSSDGDDLQVTNVDADGFDVGVKNGGSLVVRKVHWQSIGY